ncbi:MAG: dockerin type I repeat-containing protein [candidate division Zixibacteria bacterium]|nr:dockerin type I repeat-containing protein [candidate division Zixibacteria bacterium]
MKTAITLLLALVLVFSPTAHLTAQEVVWDQTYGGDYRDNGHTIRTTLDGGYVLAGFSVSEPDSKVALIVIRLNSLGDTLWTRTFDGIVRNYPPISSFDIQCTPDGGFVIAGATDDAFDERDGYVLLLDNNGDSLWTCTVGGEGNDVFQSVLPLSDGNFLLCGSTNSFGAGDYDVYLVLVNEYGIAVRSTTYGGLGADIASTVKWVPGGDYVIAGSSGEQVLVLRVAPDGTERWLRTFGSDPMKAYGVAVTSDSGFIMAGARSFGFELPFSNGMAMKVDAQGDSVWTQVYDYFNSTLFEVHVGSDGHIYLGGSQNEYYWLSGMVLKTDALGNVIWHKDYQVTDDQWSTSSTSLDIGHLDIDGTVAQVGTNWHYDDISMNYQTYVAIIKDTAYTGYLLQKKIEPDTIFAAMAHTVDDYSIDIYLGDPADGYTVADVDIGSLSVNGGVLSVTVTILPSYPSFTGEVIQLSIPARDFVLSYGLLYDTSNQPFDISGSFLDGRQFDLNGTFVLVSHTSGDVDLDGKVTIADLTLLTSHLFLGGRLPSHEAGDVNLDDLVNVADLTRLVQMLFLGIP